MRAESLRQKLRRGVSLTSIERLEAVLRAALTDRSDPRPPMNAARTAVADAVAHLLDVVG